MTTSLKFCLDPGYPGWPGMLAFAKIRGVVRIDGVVAYA